MRRPADSPAPPPPAIPDGWYSIHAGAPPQAAKAHRHSHHQDGLGLARGVHAANIRVPRIAETNNSDEPRAHRESPRHRRLQQQKPHGAVAVADAFAPNRSLRLASLKSPRLDETSLVLDIQQQKQPRCEDGNDGATNASPKAKHIRHAKAVDPGMSSRSRAARFRESRAPPIVPLHEAVCGFDDAVDASPLAESNQVAVTGLFAANWMDRFERERGLYKSIVLHAEIAFRELYRLTANVASPNDVVTAFACKIFDDMAEHFGPYAIIVRVLSSELRQSIYAPPAPPRMLQQLPYYAIVKNQKRILISLRKDQLRRQERNDFLRYEIDKVHETLLHFLDQCGVGLMRTIFREWYSVAVVSKRNSKKYVEYFSAWFGGSVKAMVPRLFLAWKGLAVETRVARMQDQLASDQAKLAAVQRQIEELTVQRDLAQIESLAIRNDRKHAEDTIQRLNRKIQSASAFLDDCQRREALVGQEGQLRVEAVTFLPPLVLESLLRGFHNVGFLQPMHSEFAPWKSVESARTNTVGKPEATGKLPTAASNGSALQQCVAALHSSFVEDGANERPSDGAASHGIPLYDCLNYVQGIRLRVEDDPTAHLVFLPKSELGGTKEQPTAQRPHHTEASQDNDDDSEPTPTHHDSPLGLQELVRHFNTALRNVRRQDEHYARHAKLFSSRMLEQSEVSVVPYATMSPLDDAPPSPLPPAVNQRVLFSSIDNARVAGSTCSGRVSELGHDGTTAECVALDQLPLLETRDFELSSQHTRAFVLLTLGQLLLEYGSLLFSPTDLTAFVRNRMLHKVMFRGIAGGKHTLKKIHVPVAPRVEDATGDGSSSDDDTDDEEEHGEGISSLAPSPREPVDHGKKSKGMGMLRKQTTQRRMQVATRRVSSYRGLHAPLAREIDSGLSHLKTAYDMWNSISQQLIQAEIVAARGTLVSSDAGGAVPVAGAVPASIDPRASAVLAGGASLVSGGAAMSALALPAEKSPTPIAAMRPRLLIHIEPLPSGPLMASAKERDRSEAPLTPNGGHRRSMAATLGSAADWSFQNSKLRQLSLDDTSRLLHAVQGLHEIVRGTAQQRAVHFAAAKEHLHDVRTMQWHHASDLASQFTSSNPAATTGGGAASSDVAAATTETGSTLLDDDRRHVFECVTFENEAIARLLSVEDHPEDELARVQALLERKKHVVRHALYCKHRAGATHAASLDDLWHVVKVLRLPRDVRVLPTLRDDELLMGGAAFHNEQLFSPDDVAEVLLQLCNEQFLPQITPLSARVEHLVAHYLPLAVQNQSAIRGIMNKSDIKKALSDHAQTLRTIFRRYCAKEKDLLAAAAAKRRAAVVAATATTTGVSATTTTAASMYNTAAASASATTISALTAAPVVAPTAPQGITKFMRLADWHEFIADYKLLRARFTAEYATVVFCNVQEAESGLEDNLEMIYSEFTEAIVALSVCFFPDPFLRHATRVHQFIRRYLPVSPEEIRDHHL